MEKLPMNDVPMLMSAINMLLRDGMCKNLDDVCKRYGYTREEIEERLKSMGFEYNEELNKVW